MNTSRCYSVISRHLAYAVYASGVLLASASSAGVVTADPETIISTQGNLNLRQADDSFAFKISGRLQWDYSNFDGVYNSVDRRASETELRRGRIKFTSEFFQQYEMELQIDINQANREARFNEARISYIGWKFATLSVGRFKEPFGLEELTSSKWVSTLERSIIFNSGAVSSGRPDTGIMLAKEEKRYTVALGIFDDGQEDANGEDDYAFTGRVTMVPYQDDNQLVHLGLAYSNRNIDNEDFRVRDRLGVRGAIRTVLFDNRPIDKREQVGLELAYLYGPFSFQGEYIDVSSDSADSSLPDTDVKGYYAQLTYTLTGESRRYKKGSFGKIKPKNRFGAIELVAKTEFLEADLHDGTTDPEFRVYTLGANYYYGENVRLGINVIHADTHGVVVENDDGDAVTARLQYAF